MSKYVATGYQNPVHSLQGRPGDRHYNNSTWSHGNPAPASISSPGGEASGGYRSDLNQNRYSNSTEKDDTRPPLHIQGDHTAFYSPSEVPDQEREGGESTRSYSAGVRNDDHKKTRLLSEIQITPPNTQNGHQESEDPAPPRNVSRVLATIKIPAKEVMSNHHSYHENMTGIEAERTMLRSMDEPCYLTRFSEQQKRYVLSLMFGNKGRFEFTHVPLVIDNDNYRYEIEGTERSFRSISNMLDYYEHSRLDNVLSSIGVPCIVEEAREFGRDQKSMKKKKRLPRHREEEEEEEEEEETGGTRGEGRSRRKDEHRHLMKEVQKMLQKTIETAHQEARGRDPDIQQILDNQQRRIDELAEQNRQLLARLPPEQPPPPQANPPPPNPPPANPPPPRRPQRQQQPSKKCPIL